MIPLRQSHALFACFTLFCGTWNAHAQTTQDNELSLREAIALTIQRSPALAAFKAAHALASENAKARAFAPPTLVEVHLENFGGTGSLSGLQAAEATLQLSHVIELGDKARLRRESGALDVDRLQAAQRAKHADVLAEVARRFVHVLSDQENLQATVRAAALAEDARDAVRARVNAGATSQIFLSRAEIALARARIEEEHAEHELASSRVALASLWAETEPSFDAVGGDLFTLTNLEPVGAYLQRLDANPDLLEFAAEDRLIDARARLAQSQRSSNITVNAGVRRLEAFDDQAFVAGFSVPLGAAKRAAPELSALRSERERVALDAQTRRLELHASLFALYQEVTHARTEAQALQTEIRPEALQLVRTSEEGYRAGRFSLTELADSQQQLLEIERDAIRAAAAFHMNLIEIERVTGEAVHVFATRELP
jgi:outer membrane protein, heavy metal efflux system